MDGDERGLIWKKKSYIQESEKGDMWGVSREQRAIFFFLKKNYVLANAIFRLWVTSMGSGRMLALRKPVLRDLPCDPKLFLDCRQILKNLESFLASINAPSNMYIVFWLPLYYATHYIFWTQVGVLWSMAIKFEMETE